MAATQYHHQHFFRKMPNADLARYFESRGIALEIDLAELKESDSEAIFQAFKALPEKQQATIEGEFQAINALAFDGGIKALIDEAAFHDEDDSFAHSIAEITGFHSKVMWAFLEKKSYWRGASRFIHADNVSPSFWKKRIDLPPAAPCVEDEDIKLLEDAISSFFYDKHAKGRNCEVNPFRRHNKEYFFAYPEDFAQSTVEWVSDKLETRARHPAFEIIFVYCEEENSLDIYAPKNTRVIPELQRIFAKTILKLNTLPDGEFYKSVYEIDALEDAKFEFTKPKNSKISGVVVTHLRLTLDEGKNRHITLTADTKKSDKAVYELLEELTLPAHRITQIGLKVTFFPEDGLSAKMRKFNITPPNSCALNYDGNDAVIREMLALSNIEPSANPD